MKIIKQNKLWYYVRNYALIFFGKKGGYERKIAALKAKFSAEELKRLEERVDYYCKLNKPTPTFWKYLYSRPKETKNS